MARAEWRRRWRSHLVVLALSALTVATGLAALMAAGRASSALDRLREETRAGDVAVYGVETRTITVDDVRSVDGVVAAAAHAEAFVRPKGTELIPGFDLYSSAPATSGDAGVLDVPLIVRGRALDPQQADEVVVSEPLAAEIGAGVGDRIVLESSTAEWVETTFSGGDAGPPDGPEVSAVVVGVARSPGDFGRYKGLLYLSPAYLERYGDMVNTYQSVRARFSEEALARIEAGRPPDVEGAEVGPSPFASNVSATDGLDTVAVTLRLVAAVALLAGAVATALAMARLTRVAMGDRRILAALGWTKRRLVGAGALVFAPWVVAGVGLGALAGVLASPAAMVGLARRVDPDPGQVLVEFPLPVAVVAGSLVAGLALVGLACRRAACEQRSARAGTMAGAGLPLPPGLLLGIRHALVGEASRGGRISRGAVVVAAGGLAAGVAALVVSSSIIHLEGDPALYSPSDASTRVIDSGEAADVFDRAVPVLEADDRVEMLVGLHVTFGLDVAGAEETTALVYDVRRGDPDPAVLEGRMAAHPDEVALGPATLDRVGKRVGDRVELRGFSAAREFRIVGSVLFPEGDFSHDEGVALTKAGADALAGDIHDAAEIHQVAFRWMAGVDTAAADEELSSAGFDVRTDDDGLRPAVVSNLGAVEALPRYLAAFVGFLALVTLGHAVVVSVRLRTHELATLRALGMTAGGCSWIVLSQALTMVVVGLVAGLPLGLAGGRQVWNTIAAGANVVAFTVTPWVQLMGVALATVVAAGVVAAFPAWRVLRLRPATVLRSE